MTTKSKIQNGLSGHPEIETGTAFGAIEIDGSTDRRPVPEWVRLIPAGRFATRDGRGPFLNDDPEGVIEATRALGMEAGLPVDYDHAIDFGAPHGAPAPAAGWVVGFEVRNGEIWGRIEWTEAGAAKLSAKEYRYISPVFELDKANKQVTRILRVALTNNPALFDTAIAARVGAVREPPVEGDMAEKDGDMDHEEFRAALAKCLGMDEDSSHEQLLARLSERLKDDERDGDDDDGEADEAAASRLIATGKVVSSEQHAALVTEINTLKAERAKEHAERIVGAAIESGKLLPAQREWAQAYCARDERGFEEFIAKQPALNLGPDGRISARPPSATGIPGGDQLSETERIVCARLGITPEAYLKSKTGGVKEQTQQAR